MGMSQNTVSTFWYVGGSDSFVDYAVALADATNPPAVNSISWGSNEAVRVYHRLFLRASID